LSFDISRFTFDSWHNFSAVVSLQGRVQLDSDWNEWLAEVSRRIQAGTLDLMGHAVYPPTTPFAFQITASASPNAITIGRGRMYVDGLLAENHGERENASWDPALAELSGSPQPPSSSTSDSNPVDYTKQPYLPGTTLPAGNGPFLAYLDVWQRPITYLEDSELIDPAVGVDTTGRLQTVWQVKLIAVPQGQTWTCTTPDSQIGYPAASTGVLSNDVITNPTAGPCCLTTGNGYTWVENQFYRVEIHQAGAPNAFGTSNGATFKWSRDNASVETGVTAIIQVTNSVQVKASQLTVLSLGRDQVLGFAPGNWIEILDDWSELWGQPGVLCQIDSIDVAGKTITLTSLLNTTSQPPTSSPPSFPVDSTGLTDPHRHTRIRRWDQSGNVYEADGTTIWFPIGTTGNNGIPVPAAGTTLILENGITVTFGPSSSNGLFNTGDFWNFSARTATGQVDRLVNAPPRGIHHHYTKLSIVSFSPLSNKDCRTPWNPSSTSVCGCCCSYTVGDGVNTFGKFNSINQAINSLLPSGGEICLLPGRFYERVVVSGPNKSDIVIRGCGWQTRLASPSLYPGPDKILIPANLPKSATGLVGVVNVFGSQHVELSSFAVEADDGEVGVLLDWTPKSFQKPTSGHVPIIEIPGVADTDVTVRDLVITASTGPAVAAFEARQVKITNNRIAMKPVSSTWPAVYTSGDDILIDHNWVGLQSTANVQEWLPTSVVNDLTPTPQPSTATQQQAEAAAETQRQATGVAAEKRTLFAPGGIQIAGPSNKVSVVENDIEGGSRNGITLGSIELLDSDGNNGPPVGVLLAEEDDCATTGTLQAPGTYTSGNNSYSVVAGGPLSNILIDRNRIRNMGLCGIGPVGFFDLGQTTEVISVANLTISTNTISNTLRTPVAASAVTSFGYGAICLPDVQNLIIRDNTITSFGAIPGAEVCGIFVLYAEMADISRNQIQDTRDWSLTFREVSATAAQESGSTVNQAGIMILFVGPPSYTLEPFFVDMPATAVYQSGLPALRLEHNVVRLPFSQALAAAGVGSFSIVNNHLGSGGMLYSSSILSAMTVDILNLGASLESGTVGNSYTDVSNYVATNPLLGVTNAGPFSNGTVLFSNNVIQMEAGYGNQQGLTSVLIFSLDHLLFANNHCWLDASPPGDNVAAPTCAVFDALLFAGTIQVNGNRFQEVLGSVDVSGLTVGLINITSNNLSSACLIASAILPGQLFNTNNATVIPSQLCRSMQDELSNLNG
jgi:hypothetical protein